MSELQTPGRGQYASDINHIMCNQPDREVCETKIKSPDGADQMLEGFDDDDVLSPLIIEELSNGEEGQKTAEYYTDDDNITLVSLSDEEDTSTGHQGNTQVKSPGAAVRQAKFCAHLAERRYSTVLRPTNGSKSDDFAGRLLRHPPIRYPTITSTTPASVAFLYNTCNQKD